MWLTDGGDAGRPQAGRERVKPCDAVPSTSERGVDLGPAGAAWNLVRRFRVRA